MDYLRGQQVPYTVTYLKSREQQLQMHNSQSANAFNAGVSYTYLID